MRCTGLLLALVFGSNSTKSVVDQEGLPFPYVVSAVNFKNYPAQGFYFKMSPLASDPHNRDDGVGIAYKAELGDKDSVLWKTSGWYASEVHLAKDGRHLVRIGNWPRGKAPRSEDVAVAFYSDGSLVKSYSTADLIKDVTKVSPSASHYGFLGSRPPGFIKFKGPIEDAKDDAQFELTTVDDVRYVFAVADGQVVSSTRR